MWGLTSPRGRSGGGSESDLLVLSFRSHHNAYREGDGSGASIERYPCPTSLSFQVIQFIFSFVIVHYLLYWTIMLATVVAIARYVSRTDSSTPHTSQTTLGSVLDSIRLPSQLLLLLLLLSCPASIQIVRCVLLCVV